MSESAVSNGTGISSAALDAAIEARMSTRAFTSQPVPRELIERLLTVASRAASSTNTQPWKVYVLQGESLDGLVQKACAAHDAVRDDPSLADSFREEHRYYPTQWNSPYIERRRENGWGLYGLLGITKGDKEKMHAQHQRNYRFFDAPVGMIFTLGRELGRGSLIDYGMFMQGLMVSAVGHGLATCPQAAWIEFSKIVLPHIGADENELLVCGLALGYADPSEPVNTFRTPRAPASAFTRWLD